MEPAQLTPMMRQYFQIKEKYRDAILFFRLGDFYEMFFEDAEKAAKILDIALTSRSRKEESAVPLCGVPYHAANPYIGKLLDAGFKVAICEQIEDPKSAQGVVQREVVRVITPGTITDAEALDARSNNFLVAIGRGRKAFGLAVADITTGEFRFSQLADTSVLVDELGRIRPSEVIFPEADESLRETLRQEFAAFHLSPVPGDFFSQRGAYHLRELNLWSGEEDEEWEQGLQAASAIISFLESNSPEVLKILTDLQPYATSQYLMLDETTRRNLEILRDLQGGSKGSLLSVLDYTQTPMGARCLRQWALYPLLDVRAIEARHEAVEELVDDHRSRQELRAALNGMRDLERLGGRIAAGCAQPRELSSVKACLSAVSALRKKLSDCHADLLISTRESMCELPEIVELLERALVDEPPATLKEGGVIRRGFSDELDEIRDMRQNAKEWIARFESEEKKRTGIQSLKVRYNRVFGYYIEVTKANLKSVPDGYMRKQTLVNGERYITPELKEYEAKVLSSDEEILKLETVLFNRVRENVASCYAQLKQTSMALARLDVLLSLAEAAHVCHFLRPNVNDSHTVFIREGRHPVVEAALGRGSFVPNDCELDPESAQILLLTGPNMAGKSTYMRQAALIVILAQMGSFVPAADARIGLVDRIFTRIGAGDSLVRGESTFMVEMKETARILRHASRRSLILLDEVGRGTSTFDGISIAWSVAEHLHDSPLRPRTLFATHYHELTDLALTHGRVKNFNFAVKEWKGEVIFLRTIREGAASHSYGIHVARLAGLPDSVVQRAREILKNLEGAELDETGRPRLAGELRSKEPAQMALFSGAGARLGEELRRIDVSVLTPIEAMNLLNELVEKARREKEL
ncbi:MAG: DNA mismatch repair protein MutS [Deltaproteobacteria bacterium]|nr:DNA mismatch repair protein MutS [Deltaproteobacteria bacterium]